MPVSATPSRDFPQRLREYEEQRHASILLVDAPTARSSLPRGWRPEDLLGGGGTRGFVPFAQAAEQMGAAEDDVFELARQGYLLAELRGTTLYVQPAIVGITRVARRDAAEDACRS
jgi:hypothetical protein